jgi:hypothetical protein
MADPPQERSLEESPNYEHYQLFEAATAGIGEKLKSQKRSQRAQYELFNIVFDLLTITQVLIGAAITALGPLGGQHMLQITILGAFNTAIAGLLALLKGRGLPQRLRRNMSELAKVLDHIENQAILLQYGSKKTSRDEIDALIQSVFYRYATAQDIIERNQPDTYTDGDLSQTHARATEVEVSPSQPADNNVINGTRRTADEEMGMGEAPIV